VKKRGSYSVFGLKNCVFISNPPPWQ
jgi:hypothetical protein